MKHREFRQGPAMRCDSLTAACNMRRDSSVVKYSGGKTVKHLSAEESKRQVEDEEQRAAELKHKAAAGIAQGKEAAARKKAARESRGEKKFPGGAAQTGDADAARAAMIERHRAPESEQQQEYTTPGAAFDTFMREPYGLQDAAEARARMIERMECRGDDEGTDKARSLAKRSPHRDSREDALTAAALRDVREAFEAKRPKPKAGQSAAGNARAAMINRMTDGR